MKIAIKLHREQKLCPDVFHYLGNIPDSILFHKQHKLRHPQNLFIVSFNKIIEGFKRVIGSYHVIVTDHKNSDYQQDLLDSVKVLLDNLASCYDDCFHIFRVLCPATGTNLDNKPSPEWLKENDIISSANLHSETQEISNYWKNQVNALKHSNTSLRYFCGSFQDIHVPGFYIEGIDSNGAKCQKETVHKKYNSMWTAYSLPYHLRLNFAYVFAAAEKLKKHVRKFILENSNSKIKIEKRPISVYDDTDVYEVSRAISEMPLKFYPDERKAPYAKIFLDDSGLNIISPCRDNPRDDEDMEFFIPVLIEQRINAYSIPYLTKP